MANYTQENRLLRITSPAFDDDFLLMNSMVVTEGISQLYEMRVELLHEEAEGFGVPDVADHKSILGQPVSIEANLLDGRERRFNGIVSEFARGSRGGGFTNYSMRVVPKIWIATQMVESRIFQQKSVPSILKEVFADFEGMIVWEFEYDYKARNYCVQYRESNFAFASRLMEEEGIYYYFEHVDDRHTMIVSDKPRFTKNCPGNNQIMYTYRVKEGEYESHVREWSTEYKLQSGVISYRDHHIQQPNKKLAVTSSTKFQISDNTNWEVYDYPGGYGRKFDGIGPGGGKTESELGNIIPDGNRVAENAMGILDAQFELSRGESDVTSFTPGHKFTLTDHPIEEQNGEYVIVSIRHTARQSPAYGSDDPESEPFLNEFTALAHGRSGTVPFRPPRVTPKPIVYGSQTAYVVGPDGEEIYTDEYGRIKVQFHWDREGKTDGSDSCWLPVAQTWSGKGWGSMFIPRIGMEVIVQFLEGNPDCPIVDGCVYHPTNLPAYELPKNKTRSGIKTDTTPGGKGFNELRFEDKRGEEQIFIHGEKDLDVRIKNDRREWTGKDQHLIVIEDLLEKIGDSSGSHHLTIKDDQKIKMGGERHVKVGSNENLEIGGTQTIKISSDQGVKVGMNHSLDAGMNAYIKGGLAVVIEAGLQLTLKAGASFIDIGPAGISISGTPLVNINSGGAAGSGSAVSICPPTAPEEPAKADDDKPGSKMQLEKQSMERKKNKSTPEDPKKKSWLKLAMNYEDGTPTAGEAYEVKTPDGKIRKGSLNNKGKAHIKGIEPGNCEVTFPNLDKDAWEDA